MQTTIFATLPILCIIYAHTQSHSSEHLSLLCSSFSCFHNGPCCIQGDKCWACWEARLCICWVALLSFHPKYPSHRLMTRNLWAVSAEPAEAAMPQSNFVGSRSQRRRWTMNYFYPGFGLLSQQTLIPSHNLPPHTFSSQIWATRHMRWGQTPWRCWDGRTAGSNRVTGYWISLLKKWDDGPRVEWIGFWLAAWQPRHRSEPAKILGITLGIIGTRSGDQMRWWILDRNLLPGQHTAHPHFLEIRDWCSSWAVTGLPPVWDLLSAQWILSARDLWCLSAGVCVGQENLSQPGATGAPPPPHCPPPSHVNTNYNCLSHGFTHTSNQPITSPHRVR